MLPFVHHKQSNSSANITKTKLNTGGTLPIKAPVLTLTLTNKQKHRGMDQMREIKLSVKYFSVTLLCHCVILQSYRVK